LERFESETLEEGEQNPIQFEDSAFSTFSCADTKHMAFATADNPFYKPERCKYFPEVIVMSTQGEVLAKLSANEKEGECANFGLKYMDDFRDQRLKLNDDKKIKFDISKITRDDVMVLFFVKTFDLSASPPKEGEFDRAMFRLSNEDTNQTIDYR
jgi:hypothetical protein